MPHTIQPVPEKGHPLVLSAREAAAQGQWDRALLDFNKALEVDVEWNRNPDFKHDRAIALFHMGQKNEALLELNEAVNLQPDYGYRFAARGWMRQALKDVPGAIADYTQAIALDPEDAISLNNLGLLEEQQGYHQEAKERFSTADELAGILKNESISTAELKPQDDLPLPQAKPEVKSSAPNLVSEIKRALRNSDGRKEFIAFLRNGFKL